MKMTVIATGSSGNCYVLEGREAALIIECGVPPEKVMAKTTLQMSKVVGVLISHEHGDHAGFADRFAGLGLPLFASRGTGLAIRQPVRPIRANHWWNLGGGFEVMPFAVRHDAAEPLGFVVKHEELGSLLFVTDSGEVPYNFKSWKVDHIMIEANYDDALIDERVIGGEIARPQAMRVKGTHLSIREAIEFVRANETEALKTVTLLHLSAQSADRVAFQRKMQDAVLFADVVVARPGVVRVLSPLNLPL